jgi:probable rRNA maturation factor
MPVRFFTEEIDFKIRNPRKIIKWIVESTKKENCSISEISYIFCTDKHLLGLNKDFLNHKTLTDIITFDYTEGSELVGDIYISIDRIKENSLKFRSTFEEELHRVMIHGILHLCGYKDKKPSEKLTMRKKEDAYLSLQKKMFHVER